MFPAKVAAKFAAKFYAKKFPDKKKTAKISETFPLVSPGDDSIVDGGSGRGTAEAKARICTPSPTANVPHEATLKGISPNVLQRAPL